MFLVSGLAFQAGDPRLLVYPKDTEGRVCGLSGTYNGSSYDYKDKAYLYYFNPLDTSAAQVCVASCPTATSSNGVDVATTSTTICRDGVTPPTNTSDLATDVQNNECAGVIYNSENILYRCIPTAIKSAMDSALTSAGVSGRSDNSTTGTDYGSLIAKGEDYFVKIVNDIAKTWYWILAGAGGALVITLFYTVLIRYLCGLFVWTCILFSLALCYGFSVWLWFFWQDRKNYPYPTSDAQQAQWEQYSAMGMFIAMCSISGIMTLVMLFLRKRIRIAVQVMKEAMKAVAAIPTMLLFPFVTFFLVLVLVAFFFATMAFLASPTKPLTFAAFNASFSGDLPWQILQYYHIFGFLWTFAVLMGINQVTIAGAVATWYWARDKRAIPSSPVLRSFGRVLRYSMGSVALGALLIAISQAIRLILFRVQRTASAAGKNKPVLYCLSCLQCCMGCVESLLKFINRNAYIEIAIYGNGFCKSARTAFELLVRNALRLVAVDAVSDFILFAGKVFVSFGCGFAAYLFFNWQQSNLNLSYIFAPSLIVGVIAWMIASCFFSAFGIAIDTIFLSFAEDCERNDGSADRPYFMSNNLMKITGLNNLKAKGYGEFISEDVAESREMRLNEF